MKRFVYVIPTLCVLAALAGCGGGSGGGSSLPQTTENSSTASQTTAVKKAPSKATELWKFLGQVKPIRLQYNVWNDRAGKTLSHIYNVCCTGWTAANIKVNRKAGKIARQDADELAAIQPPAQLRRAYLAYVDTYRQAGEIDAAFASQLASKQSFSWQTWNNKWDAEQVPVTHFRIALIAYAAANHIPLPAWAHRIGGK